jgi:hypothetical protein
MDRGPREIIRRHRSGAIKRRREIISLRLSHSRATTYRGPISHRRKVITLGSG